MSDWTKVLRAVAPRAKPAVIDEIAPYLDEMFSRYNIADKEEQAQFIAQCAHESASFTTLVEFGSDAYFKRYEWRKDLGNVRRGDGLRYKGRGIFQLTGRANYLKYGRVIGVDLIKEPQKAAQGYYAVQLACIYWTDRHIGPLARAGNIKAVTKKINGGLNGFRDRQIYLARARKALGVVNLADRTPVTSVGFMSTPLVEQSIPDKDMVEKVQKRLFELGYKMVGKADGKVGGSTVAAISAFQHDNGFDTTGHLDDETVEAILHDDADDRPISDERANGKPEDSDILKGAGAIVKGAGGLGIGGAATLATDGLSKVEAAKGYYERVSSVLEPFTAIKAIVFSPAGLSVLAIAVAAGIGFYAWRIRNAQVEAYREGSV
ncbi:MAG: peptidoglycan-binding protein [Rhizobiaceae bacterium]|nr:peptidoglycan-binding protein [Rhizobiaceae bacterium]MCC0000985.1 peptidoglycan-binding protein [Methylobacteriaceae bacterium]